jgi:hypothetical protein
MLKDIAQNVMVVVVVVVTITVTTVDNNDSDGGDNIKNNWSVSSPKVLKLTFINDCKYNIEGSNLRFYITVSHSYLVMALVQFDVLCTSVITTISILVP